MIRERINMKLKDYYQKTVSPALKERFGYKNVFQVPKIEKVVVNVGLNSQSKDPKKEENVVKMLKQITGQAPTKTLARKSIAGFKVRQGMVVGAMVTLRGARMFDFIERLIKITLPRLRDFQGINSSSLDARGNLSLGLRESVAFPELRTELIEGAQGLEITIVTTAKTKEEGLALFKLLGFPLQGVS